MKKKPTTTTTTTTTTSDPRAARAARYRAEREKRGTQAEVAALLGLTLGTVYCREAGKRRITPEAMRALLALREGRRTLTVRTLARLHHVTRAGAWANLHPHLKEPVRRMRKQGLVEIDSRDGALRLTGAGAAALRAAGVAVDAAGVAVGDPAKLFPGALFLRGGIPA